MGKPYKCDEKRLWIFRDDKWLINREFKGKIVINDYVWGHFSIIYSNRWKVTAVGNTKIATVVAKSDGEDMAVSLRVPVDFLADQELEDLGKKGE
jgi:hypothetical protein